jgi:hypothetical protein
MKHPKAIHCRIMLAVIAAVLGSAMGAHARSVLQTWPWPVESGQAVVSQNYRVTLSNGSQSVPSQVLVSNAWTEPGGGPDAFRGRTFSWTSFGSNFTSPVTVTVEKLFGEPAKRVEVFPSGYGIEPILDETGRKVTFRLQEPRYVSVRFDTADNTHAMGHIIRHMLMVFADPLESAIPDIKAQGVVVFDAKTTQAELDAAQTVYFKPGFYRLKDQFPNGTLEVRSGQTLYVSGGAFIVGKLHGKNLQNTTLRGRGVISGRDWAWVPNLPIGALIELAGTNTHIEGIIACDTDMHGIVPGHSTLMEYVKMWGWHYNNDGFRPWGGRVHHCFLRPVDDAFYVGGSPLIVTDTVIWQGFNGAVVTCGWGSPEKPYNTKDFIMRDCHILYPEWNRIGNNNGLLASQLPYNATSANIHFENIRVDGNVAALTNLKRNENQARIGQGGGISNVLFKNVHVTGRQVAFNWNRSSEEPSYSVIRGDGDFRIKGVRFEQVSIAGELLDEANAMRFFHIDPDTTSDIGFSHGCETGSGNALSD